MKGNLVWKLLRQHISIPQLAGFFFANLIGMSIVLLAYQFYRDVVPMLTAEDGVLKSDFVVDEASETECAARVRQLQPICAGREVEAGSDTVLNYAV